MRQAKKLSRRDFLRISATTALGAAAAACAPAAPQVVEVEKPVVVKEEVIKEVPVEKVVEVEKVVKETVVVEKPAKEVEITVILPDRELSKKVNALKMMLFNEEMKKAGKPWRMMANVGPAEDGDYHTKLTVDAAAGTLSDVVNMHPVWIADFAAAGYLLDLTPYVEQWDGWDHYYPIVREQATFDGKVRVIPGVSTMTFFYRKDVLEEAGISTEQPKTWQDFYDICDQIKTKTGKKAVCLPAATPWGGGTFNEGFKQVWLSFESPLYNTETEKWVVKSEGLLNALKVYETLAKNGWLTVEEMLQPRPWVPTKYEAFPKGDLVICTGGDWQWEFDWGPNGATPIEGLFEKVDRWMFPSQKGEPFAYVGIGWGTGIFSQSKAPDGAFEWLKFTNRPDILCEGYKIYLGGVASRDDVAEACEYYRTAVAGKMVEAEEYLKYGRSFRPQPGLAKIADGIARATERVITLEMTPEQAMEAFAQEMEEALGADQVEQE